MTQRQGSTLCTTLTEQQLELFDHLTEDLSLGSISEVLTFALNQFFTQEAYHFLRRRFQPGMQDLTTAGTRPGTRSYQPGPRRLERLLEPVSGKAVPVAAGEVLRISQIEGEQCVDFNAFNLHDSGERMSVGHSRRQGFRLVEGDDVLSNRLRPLLHIAHMPPTCVTDLLGARCNGPMFDRKFGFGDHKHTNCQDTLAESIREFGLSSDDVHDSFNMWMNTNWDGSGTWWVEWNSGTPSDYVDLVACYDTLCVPVTCGSGDVHPTSNFFLRPINIEVFEASESTNTIAEAARNRHASVHSGIRTGWEDADDRGLQARDDYRPSFLRFPLERREIEITDAGESVLEGLQAMVDNGWAQDLGDAARKAMMLWYLRNAAGKNNASVGGRFRW